MPSLGLNLGLQRAVNVTNNPIMNQLGGYVGVWSLKKLTAQADKCIRVRRDNDDSEQDIGFVGRELDTASLLSFVGSNSAYVTTWYDQSGNGNHATQSTADYQPRIVDSGTIDTDSDGNVSLYFDGTNDFFKVADSSGLDITSGGLSLVARHDPDRFFGYVISRNEDVANVQYGLLTFNITNSTTLMLGGQIVFDESSDLVSKVCIGTYDFTNAKMYLDGALIDNSAYSSALTSRPNVQIGCRSSAVDGSTQTVFYKGHISDIAVFPKALTQAQVTRLTNAL